MSATCVYIYFTTWNSYTCSSFRLSHPCPHFLIRPRSFSIKRLSRHLIALGVCKSSATCSASTCHKKVLVSPKHLFTSRHRPRFPCRDRTKLCPVLVAKLPSSISSLSDTHLICNPSQSSTYRSTKVSPSLWCRGNNILVSKCHSLSTLSHS